MAAVVALLDLLLFDDDSLVSSFALETTCISIESFFIISTLLNVELECLFYYSLRIGPIEEVTIELN